MAKESVETAIGYFEQAIRLDPGFAAAYASLADCYSLGFYRGMDLPPPDARAKAELAIQRALQLDPLSNIINQNVGIDLVVQHRYDDAIQQLNKAVALDPAFSPSHAWLGVVYEQKGKYDVARRTAGVFQSPTEKL